MLVTTLLRPLALVLPLAFVVGGVSATRHVHDDYRRERDRTLASCRAFRTAPGRENAGVCRNDDFARRLDRQRRGSAALDDARRAGGRADVFGFADAVGRVIDEANHADDDGTLLGTLVANKLYGELLDVLERHRGIVDNESRRTLLARAHFRSAEHPFDTARIDAAWRTMTATDAFPVTPIAEMRAVEAIRESNIVLSDMDRALVERDVGRCELAQRTGGPRQTLQLGATWCKKIRDVMDTGERLALAKRTGRAVPDFAAVHAEMCRTPANAAMCAKVTVTEPPSLRASPSAPYTIRAAPPLSMLRPIP